MTTRAHVSFVLVVVSASVGKGSLPAELSKNAPAAQLTAEFPRAGFEAGLVFDGFRTQGAGASRMTGDRT